MKSGSLNFLETSGPVQAFTGIALPLYVHFRLCKKKPTRSGIRNVCLQILGEDETYQK